MDLTVEQVDERAVAAREVTALRSSGSPSASGHNSPTAASMLAANGGEFAAGAVLSAGSALVRQGSMNLPKPEESGVPATHPDMCILRIRRQHLLEVQLYHHGQLFLLFALVLSSRWQYTSRQGCCFSASPVLVLWEAWLYPKRRGTSPLTRRSFLYHVRIFLLRHCVSVWTGCPQ